VQEYLRAMLRDMGVNSMTTVQGCAASIARKKQDASDTPEVYDQVAKELAEGAREDTAAAVDTFMQDCMSGGDTAAACMMEGSEKVQRAHIEATVKAMEAMDTKPDPQDVPVAVLRHIAQGGDLSWADEPIQREKPFNERKREFLENLEDPADRKRIEQMTPEEFAAMEKAVLGGGRTAKAA